jgi:hypothetical protein
MSGVIANLFQTLAQLKQDFKLDWKEDAKDDWKVDWAVGAPGEPANTVAPVISGSLAHPAVLTSTTGTWTGTPSPTFMYQWFNSSTGAISGATSSTYTTQASDVGFNISCHVYAVNVHGTVMAVSNSLGPVT